MYLYIYFIIWSYGWIVLYRLSTYNYKLGYYFEFLINYKIPCNYNCNYLYFQNFDDNLYFIKIIIIITNIIYKNGW